ncbi:TonB-dependent receptor plug domain-containing protein [Altererythrobacter sp. C41]|uniref:TonB-dependent receptor plug domain-containing protein n=1 Tax=Altererythrobacter sp. C41 TaxID=2806021 RepID=UPI00193210E3|nr:TonB-dependent receptor [Altererythrobacter sp. C41]MBM0168701.1 TonB-dependent receptor [Altererythrobacter sp. C41]
MRSFAIKGRLFAGAGVAALSFAAFASPAMAQDEPDPTLVPDDACADPNDPNCAAYDQDDNVIVVTGSILRRTDTEAPSPVTVLSAETLEERGINTVAEAVQRLSANGAGTITQGWNTGFNFASGANAPALRGLTVQATLSISDGLRMAPYPLADDGQRNFVDLNTIPNAVVERIEVLRDGASSTYGADAIAGVINVITKKEIQGLHLGGSVGVSQRGDAGEQRIDATWGYGDLAEQGFNFYVSGEYQKQDALWARDRGYPFNTQDWTGVCGASGSCLPNLNWNGYTPEDGSFNGLISIPGVTLVRPVDDAPLDPDDDDDSPPNPMTGAGRFEFLNPAAGCLNYNMHQNTAGSGTAPLAGVCEVDFHGDYIMLQPEIERRGLTARFTANVGDRAQIYAIANYYNTKTHASFTPLGFNGTPTPPNNGVAAYNVMLPVYVCNTGVGTPTGTGTGCDATNGVLNPYNPYAADGRTAQAFVRSTRPRTVDTSSRSLRGVLGIDGTFGDDWRYSASFTGSEVRLKRGQDNYYIPQRIMDAVARGQINFNDLEATPEDIWDYIGPRQVTTSVSELWQVQGTLAKDLFELPGGPLQAAVGLSYRDESIDAPSGNPGTLGNQYDRYYSINSVGTSGSRNVKSAFFEVGAPIVEQFEVNVSGRYDDYSTGQSNFSPKVGVKFTPIPQLALRGTFSKGFRIPSFNESFGLPTTGYVTRTVNCETFAAFCAAHGDNAYATGNYSLGLTQVGNPELDPEKSTAFTAGVVYEPIRNVSLTVDFWHIEVKDLIVGVTDTSAAEAAYYANNGVVDIPGITVIPGQPDPAFPNALPLIGFIQSSFTNENQQTVSGIDFGARASLPIGDAVTWRTDFDASYMLKYELKTDDGEVLRYDGTLSPCNITSCSGSPKWRATWQNTLEFGDTAVSLTAYYTKGYDTASIDFGGIKGDCAFNAENGTSTHAYIDGTPVNCKTEDIWNLDLTVSQKVGDRFTIYANVLNLLDTEPPFDPDAAYALFGFNPAWAGPNIMGRYFRLGAKVDF